MLSKQAIAPAETILQVSDVHRHFGGVAAVAGADFAVRRGSITGLLEPNGAGKTTLFNIVAGSIPPSSGRILLEGRDVTGRRPDELAHLGLTRPFQLARGLSDLTVLENFALYAKAHPGETLWRVFLDASSVKQREEAAAGGLGAGAPAQPRPCREQSHDRSFRRPEEAGRVGPGPARPSQAAPARRSPWPASTRRSRSRSAITFCPLRDRGVTILVIEHNMSFIRQICDHVIVLAAGKVIAEGSFEEVRANETVQAAYFELAVSFLQGRPGRRRLWRA